MAEGELEPGDPYSWSDLRAEAARRFGVRRFRPGQRELIDAALQGRDVLGILPTGAGKSLCYQLPSLLLKGAVVVVSPLLALMRDQAERLDAAGVEGARLDSTVPEGEQRRRVAELEDGAHDVLLVTPERLVSGETLDTLRARGVALVVVDEAHCVSQWGHDFRPAYLGLRDAIARLGRPAVMALTATAPPDLARDILEHLGIPGAEVVQTGIERPNLRFEVARTVNEDEKRAALLGVLDACEGSVIVYAGTVRTVVELQAWLASRDVACVRYHGQLGKREREAAQRRFMQGEARVVVATNAFGLGIDKPDVRAVVHWQFPESLEAYYQEAGRAGRDGAPARATLLFRLEDRGLRRAFLGGRHPRRHEAEAVLAALVRLDREGRRATLKDLATASALGERRVAVIVDALRGMDVLVRRGRGFGLRRALSDEELARFHATFEERYAADRERLDTMMEYGRSTACRMQFLREYFGEPAARPCGRCDNCTDARAVEAVRDAPRPPAAHELHVVDVETPAFDAGARVGHATFGAGRVVEANGDVVTVAFESGENRTLRAEFLRAAAPVHVPAG